MKDTEEYIPANETYPLNDAMTHCITLDESKRRIENLVTQAGELWDKLNLNQQKLEEMCSIHERLPYQ